MIKITYSLANDFNSIAPYTPVLKATVLANQNITTDFYGITTAGDDIDFLFAQNITGPEQIELDSIVSNYVYVPPTPQTNKLLSIQLKTTAIKKSSYTLISRQTYFPGSIYASATINSYMEGSGSYDVRIVDKNNKNVLLTYNLTNTIQQITDLGQLVGLSENETMLEAWIQTNGSSKAYIDDIVIKYVGDK